MKSTTFTDERNEEITALECALNENIEKLAITLISIEDEVQIQIETEEDQLRKEAKRKKDEEDRKQLEREWRKRATELYNTRKNLKKTLDEMVCRKII